MCIRGQKNASKFKSGSSSWNSMSSIVDTWYPLVSFPFVPRFESTSSLISCFVCSFALILSSAKKSTRRSCLWENNIFQVARRNFWQPMVIAWTSFIQSEQLNPGESGETNGNRREKQKNRLLCWKPEWYKIRKQNNFWLIVLVNGKSTGLCYKWNELRQSWVRFMAFWLFSAEILLQLWGRFFCPVVTTRFLTFWWSSL